MEYDRYGHHKKLYILGIICLLLALIFLFFSIYIIPFLLWNFSYDVPGLIHQSIAYLQDQYGFTLIKSKSTVWLSLLALSATTGYISYRISNYIDNELLEQLELQEENSLPQKRNQLLDSVVLMIRILVLMFLIVLMVLVLEQLIRII